MGALRQQKDPSTMSYSLNQKILAGSGTFVIAMGAAAFLKAEKALSIMDTKGTICSAPDAARYTIATAFVGWGVGKLTAVTAGDEAVTTFATWNLVPMVMGIYGNHDTGDTQLMQHRLHSGSYTR